MEEKKCPSKKKTITFTKNKTPPTGSIVILLRHMQVGIKTEFGNAQSFNGRTLHKLPVLTTQDNQVWVSQGRNIIAMQIESTDVSILCSELASQAPNGGDGTNLVGYYSAAEKRVDSTNFSQGI